MPLPERKPVPVLLMCRELGAGGSERQLTEVAKALDRSRFSVHVGCFRDGFQSEELRRSGVSVVRLPVTSFASSSAIRGAVVLNRYLRRERIQVVHTFDYPLTVFAVPVARGSRVPVVLSSVRGNRALNPASYNRVLRWTDKLVDGIVVNCEALRRSVAEDEGVPAGRIHVCRNGIDISKFAFQRDPQPDVTIGVVCVLRPEKGLDTLIEAFAAVYRTHPVIRLVIVGSGPELPRLQDLAGTRGVSAACHFEPATSNVASWLARMDIFVLPSLNEALSNALMEAMACGCAVIASNVGGNPELVEDGTTGLLFEVRDAASLAVQLRRLLDDSALRTRLSRSGSQRMQRDFSIESAAARMGAIYDSFLQKT